MRSPSSSAALRRLVPIGLVAMALVWVAGSARSNQEAEPVAAVDPQYEVVAEYISLDAWNEMLPFQRSILVGLAERHAAQRAAHPDEKLVPVYAACFEYGGEANAHAIAHAMDEAAPEDVYGDFRLQGSTWTETATDGPGLTRGDPMTFTWGIVPDGTTIPSTRPGEPTSGSDLIAFLDGLYDPASTGGADLTQRAWFPRFTQVFTVWANTIGTEYVYEAADDMASFPPNGGPYLTFPGIRGVRADFRVGGHYIDGQTGSNTLAYNYYPEFSGEMVIDTSNTTFFGDATANSRGLRNTLSHEHGLGLAHVCSTDRDFLMEPFINLTFDGPQEDDILGAHRMYGDPGEFPDGNDSPADYDTLVDVSLAIGSTVTTYGGTWSIDGTSDVDVFAFDLISPDALVTVSVNPFGTTYDEGPQVGNSCTSAGPFNAQAQNDLMLELVEFDGTPIVAADANGLGVGETISSHPVANPGLVYFRVSGNIDAGQRYDWQVSVIADPSVSPMLPVAPAAANGFLRLLQVRGAAGGTLALNAKLDFGDGSFDLSQPCTFQYGTKTLNLAAGALVERRPGLWFWRSADRKRQLIVREPRYGSSSGALQYRERGHTDTLPGGNQFHAQFTRGAFDVQADVEVVGGSYRAATTPGTNAPLAVTNFVAHVPAGADNDSFSLVAEFPSDMVIPASAPDVTVRVGPPGGPLFQVLVPNTASIASTFGTQGYRYRVPDPDGLGPLQPEGLWYVVVDYTRRSVRAFARGVNLGTYPAGSAPVYISVGVGAGNEAAVEIEAANFNTAAEPYLRYR